MKRTLLCMLLPFLIFSTAALSCPETHGKSEKDRAVAKRLCDYEAFDVLKDHLVLTSVQETILYLDIDAVMYRGLYRDQATARQAIRNLSRIFQKEVGRNVVTVWFYFNKDRVIEADRTGDRVEIQFL